MNADDKLVEEKSQPQVYNENCNYSPETFQLPAGNLEFTVGKVTALCSRLRKAPFIDIDSVLN